MLRWCVALALVSVSVSLSLDFGAPQDQVTSEQQREHAHQTANIEEGLGLFEDRWRMETALTPNAAGPDLRVSKAMGNKGYNKVRLSIITQKDATMVDTLTSRHLKMGDQEMLLADVPFQHKWLGAFDLGKAHTACGHAVYETKVVKVEDDCVLLCTHDAKCKHFTWFNAAKRCELAGAACTFAANASAEATYTHQGQNHVATAVVELQPGVNNITFDGVHVSIRLPAPKQGVRGIVIADPCYTGRWIGCMHGAGWNAYERTITMLNALAEKDGIEWFAILGDNFYDRDGRITKNIWDKFSLKFKSKFLLTVPGNHDIWVGGGPASGTTYDQYGWGYMQWYAQDTAATLNPQHQYNFALTETDDRSALPNNATNFFYYHQLGNLGFIGFNGGFQWADMAPSFRQACTFMKEAKPDFIFLLGHWNHDGLGCSGASTPDVHNHIKAFPGCDIGDKLKFIDGHSHCNEKQQKGKDETVGFMLGGHGMGGCSQYGFGLVDSTNGRLRVSYFQERDVNADHYSAILDCINTRGAEACSHTNLAANWLDTKA